MQQMEADRDRQLKEMKNSLFGFISAIGQPQAQRPPEPQQ
jgi:hypothetical protein